VRPGAGIHLLPAGGAWRHRGAAGSGQHQEPPRLIHAKSDVGDLGRTEVIAEGGRPTGPSFGGDAGPIKRNGAASKMTVRNERGLSRWTMQAHAPPVAGMVATSEV
jgi:hypothetical protein